MGFKSFAYYFGSTIATTVFLYFLGHFFDIPWFKIQYEYVNNTNTHSIEFGTLLPLVIGLIVGFFVEKSYLRRQNKQMKT